jgi:hypothetical protein
MVLVTDPTVRVDLQSVVVRGGVLEQPVVGVEHLLGQQVEPLPSHAAVVEPDLEVQEINGD